MSEQTKLQKVLEMVSKAPLGVKLLGGFNLFIRGIIFLIGFLLIYSSLSPQTLQQVQQVFSEQNVNIRLNSEQVRLMLLPEAFIAMFFIISGAGLLLRKEWARWSTVYFSFFLVTVIFLAALFNPSLIAQALVQVIHPGLLIVYFTNKKAANYFVPEQGGSVVQE